MGIIPFKLFEIWTRSMTTLKVCSMGVECPHESPPVSLISVLRSINYCLGSMTIISDGDLIIQRSVSQSFANLS